MMPSGLPHGAAGASHLRPWVWVTMCVLNGDETPLRAG